MTEWIYNKHKKGKISDCEGESEETVVSLTGIVRKSWLEDKDKDVRFEHDELKATISNPNHVQLRVNCATLRLSKLSFLICKTGATITRDSLSYCEDCVESRRCQRPLKHWKSNIFWPLLVSISYVTNCPINLCCYVNLWLSDTPLIRIFFFFSQYNWDKPKHFYSNCSPCKISRASESGQFTTWRGLQIYDKFTTTNH